MLKVIVDHHIPFVLMGIFVAVGVISKFIVSITLKKLVKAASDMSKSSHALIRLVRAKFEHACMVSDKVQNVEVFAQKYLYEYKVLGVRLHKWQRTETGSAVLCLVTGALGGMAGYHVYGMSEETFRIVVTGAVEAVLLFLLHRTTDEKYQLEAVKTYMVDYLENVCARRLEKAMKKEENNPELSNPERPRPRNEVPAPVPVSGLTEPAMPAPNPLPDTYPLPEIAAPIPKEFHGAELKEELPRTPAAGKPASQKRNDKQDSKKEKKEAEKEVRIREILEEFLA